jgi:hypothetical protein
MFFMIVTAMVSTKHWPHLEQDLWDRAKVGVLRDSRNLFSTLYRDFE